MIDLRKAPPELFAQMLETNLRGIGPARKLHGHFVEAVRLRLGAGAARLAGEGGEILAARGDGALVDRAGTAAFRRGEPAAPGEGAPGAILARVVVHGRTVAIAGAAWREEPPPGARRTLDRLCAVLARELARREDARLAQVLDRIRGKIVSELRPRDLAYQILDGLHQLVDYDHSSAFLTWEPASRAFHIEAEKVVWTKGKSADVGREIAAPREVVEALARSPGIRRLAAGGGDPFWTMLDYHRGRGIPAPASLLCAPLVYGGEFLGLLKIAARARRPFDRRDEAVVERFLPAAAVSIRNARVNMTLERQAIQAELKATLVTLASAVAHDVNNAVGTILPLVQQVREDLAAGGADPAEIDRDLEVVVEKARLCQRIFSNMLRVARSGHADDGPVDLNQVVEETLPFFEGQALRRGIAPTLDLAPGLSPVRFSRQDLQHIVVNLVVNSLEALEGGGGRIEIETRATPGGALLAVADDGPGIPPELLGKVQEPFFSTKSGGTGLGLAICRALAWQNGGGLEIESLPGRGTRVTLELQRAGVREAAAVPVEAGA